jgi:hypothetical protein
MDYAAALELSAILELAPPKDPSPPAPPPPPPALPERVVVAPPPVPEELRVDPVEAAVFRAAEALGVSATPLRPVLARFLGHVAALGITAAEAQLRLG